MLDSVDVVDAHDITIIRALALRHRLTGSGVIRGFPPSPSDLHFWKGVDWPHRQRIPGAILLPTQGNVEYDVFLAFQLTRSARGTVNHVELHYHQGSSHYTLNSNLGARLPVPGTHC